MHPADLETSIHRELRGLRPPAAPATLLPRVLAAVQAWAGRPWYQRAWFTWPAAGQAVALLTLAAVATAIAVAVAGADTAIGTLIANLVDRPAPIFSRARLLLAVAGTLLRALLQPAIAYRAYTFALLVGLGAACATLGTALHRMSDGRTRWS